MRDAHRRAAACRPSLRGARGDGQAAAAVRGVRGRRNLSELLAILVCQPPHGALPVNDANEPAVFDEVR